MSFTKSHKVAIMGLSLCFALSLSLSACNSEKKESPQQQAEYTESTSEDVNGVPDKEAPVLQLEGADHKGETLHFVTIGTYNSQEEAQEAYNAISKILTDGGQQKNFWKVINTNVFVDVKGDKVPSDKFVVAHAYPSQEAVEGYAAKDYAEGLTPSGAQVRVFQATFNTNEKIVVLGIDAQ